MAESLANLIPTPLGIWRTIPVAAEIDELAAFFSAGHLPGNKEEE